MNEIVDQISACETNAASEIAILDELALAAVGGGIGDFIPY